LSNPPTNWLKKFFGLKTANEITPPVKELIPEVVEEPKTQLKKKDDDVIDISGDVGKRKLNSDQVMKVLFLIATFEKVPAIIKAIRKEFGISISKTTVEYYKRNEQYRGQIQKMRERWGSDLLNVELSNKRRRLEELEKIYNHCYANDQMKNALASLYQIQNEIEKDLQNIGHQTNYQINIFKDMSETELEEERIKSLERLKQLKQIPELKEVEDAVREEEKKAEEMK